MNRLVSRIVISALIAGATNICVVSAQSARHEFSVADSISMTRLNEPSDARQAGAVPRSPDGRFFYVVTSRGLIASNQIESTIWLFKTRAIKRFMDSEAPASTAPNPIPIARIRAVPDILTYDAYAPVITDVRWSSDSKRIFFLGMDSHAEKRLYEVNLRLKRQRALTPIGQGVRQFIVRGGLIAYTENAPEADNPGVPWNPLHAINRAAGAVTGMGLEDILSFPEEGHGMGSARTLPDLWVGSPGNFHRVPNPGHREPIPDAEHYDNVLSLSPDGTKVVRLLPIEKLDNSWSMYEPKPGFESWKIKPNDNSVLSPSYWYRLRGYRIIDIRTGKISPLIDGPYGISLGEEDLATAVWSQDGKRLLLGNVGMPLNVSNPREQSRRKHICAIASVDLVSSESHCIAFTRDAAKVTPENPRPLRLKEAFFGANKDEVYLHVAWHGQWGQTERYRYRAGQWTLEEVIPGDPLTGAPVSRRDDKKAPFHGIAVSIKQDLNTPPTLWASGLAKAKQIWDPNPQLGPIQLGKASLFHWKDADAYSWTGVLVVPPGYEPGKRYPLVIQTHGYRDFAFITDGIYPTAMAARALSSAGFIVLQTTSRPDHMLTAQEATDEITGWKAAIAQLDRDGLVDPTRVGVIGFSRTCWYVEQALIDAPKLFAAATIADGVDNSYMTYRLFGEGRPTMAKEYRKIIGTSPVGDGLAIWMQHAPSFRLDKVVTPLRIEAIGPSSVLMEWEIYASLRDQHKPVDLIYIPGGQHILQKPLDRLASQQGNVDWFRFWLEGYTDPAPQKVQQYRRWKMLRP